MAVSSNSHTVTSAMMLYVYRRVSKRKFTKYSVVTFSIQVTYAGTNIMDKTRFETKNVHF